MQDVCKFNERQKEKSELCIILQKRLRQASKWWHAKWVFLSQWCSVLCTGNVYILNKSKECNICTQMVIPAVQTLSSRWMNNNDPRFPVLVLFSDETILSRESIINTFGLTVIPTVLTTLHINVKKFS
ncbi:hypothetical protein TNCT_116631 [Trichonephila clavata]|uniref:Uncharacterized protein n=1 Tax=Trichonephila clavata TaxID=2740835 RepID=A0A8X6KBD7_TRICU|nr:hypothetical protein TNCT_116631 [Trichonephila clavata]